MSITTFAKLITTPGTKKIFLVEIEPSEQKISWTLYSGSIYYTDVEAIDITSVVEGTTTLTEVSSISAITAGTWFHDVGKVYLQPSSGTPYSKIIVFNYKMYFATETINLNNYYEGIVKGIPVIKQEKKELYWGVSIISGGNLSLINNNGFFEQIYKDYAWNNKNITILLGGEDLPYSEYTAQFGGQIIEKNLSTDKFDIKFEDKKNELEATIPTNNFSTTEFPNLDSEDEGKPKPLVYGTVYKIPVICTTKALGTATSLHSFKILDTSVCTVNTLSTVYVNDVSVSYQSASVSDASFKLATSTYSPGDSVTVDIIADVSNPIEQLKAIASNVLSIPYNSTNYDTATVSQAVTDSSVYPTGLFIGENKTFLDVIGDLMQSCMGSFFVNNSGKYSIIIWDTELDDDLTTIDYIDIIEKTFKINTILNNIRKTIRVGWRKNWDANTYAYKQLSSDTTEKIYGIKKTKTIPTLQSTEAGVNILVGRLGLIYESATAKIEFATKIQLAAKNIGDRIQISFKRRAEDTAIEWLDEIAVEIIEIEKDFTNNKITTVTDDLKGVGAAVGHWTEDSPVFPDAIGGGSAVSWNSSWSAAKKNYYKKHFGSWLSDDGFADNADSDSDKISRFW